MATDQGDLYLFNTDFDVIYKKQIDDNDMTFDDHLNASQDDKYID